MHYQYTFFQGFDMVILGSKIITYAKETGKKGVSLHREGSKIRFIKVGGVWIAEIKRLLSPGSSLSRLARTCNLVESKMIFPFDRFTSPAFLQERRLPAFASAWSNELNPDASPTQQDVDSALAEFESHGDSCVGSYLKRYLRLDVIILLKSVVALKKEYYAILGLDFVECCKYTVSSLSALGAQSFLFRSKRVGQFFVNHSRMYSVSFFFSFVLPPPPTFFSSSVAQSWAEGRFDSRVAHRLRKSS